MIQGITRHVGGAAAGVRDRRVVAIGRLRA